MNEAAATEARTGAERVGATGSAQAKMKRGQAVPGSGALAGQPFRRAAGGTVIDRSQPVTFTFDGRRLEGFAGDTVASALLASGRQMVARSFKYHRPRGIFGAGAEDPAALVQIGRDQARTEPNLRATEQEIFDGLEVTSQNAWPSLGFDVGRVNDLMHRFLPAGFYYKTFMGPPLSWMRFERVIRAAAGLGRAPRAPDPDRYEHVNVYCDVLVVGGGAAGISAARAAGRSGARVTLVEETADLGGWLLAADPVATRIDGETPQQWIAAARQELQSLPEVRVLTRTAVFGYYADNFLCAWERVGDHLPSRLRDSRLPRQREWRIRAKEVVLATGMLERPLLFHGNDVPGVMLASAAVTFANRYGVLPGRRIAVATDNDSGYASALALQSAGAEIAALIDTRPEPGAGVGERVRAAGIPLYAASAIARTRGGRRIRGVEITGLGPAGAPAGTVRDIGCDCLAVAGGFSPNIALFSQSRGQLAYDPELGAFRPGVSWQHERSGGGASGAFGLRAAIAGGAQAGAEAAAAAGFAGEPPLLPEVDDPDIAPGTARTLAAVPSLIDRPRAFVDLQNDVTTKDLELAVREGYGAVEHAKRYTTSGMGTDQGKTVNIPALNVLAAARGEPIPRIGSSTYRQPYKPVTFGAVAGQHVGPHFAPRRTSPMHREEVEAGAIFEVVGDWLRAWVYPRAGETSHQALLRECRAARAAVGVLDASTLGKIDIRGKDARTFLNRIYTNAWSKLAPGRCRYGLMLGEDGMVMDDGVTSCITDDHFHMTTTTGGAAAVLAHLEEYLQTEWPDLDVYVTTVTEQWAVLSVCGRNSAALMANLTGDPAGMDPEAFPFMTWKEASIDGIPARIFRISFTGDLSYEINVPARYGPHLWRRVMAAGEPLGVTPYGTEAMHLLRAEKGFIIVGQDTDGTVTPHDLRMGWIVGKTKGDFVGRRSLARKDIDRGGRKQLVGLLTEDPAFTPAEGAHIIATADEPSPPVPMLGHVTSSYFSPNLDRSIALALVRDGGNRIGETVWVTVPGGGTPVAARISDTDFLAMTDLQTAPVTPMDFVTGKEGETA